MESNQFKLLALGLITLISLPLLARVPKQSEVVRDGVFRYFKNLPHTISTHTAHSLKMGDYHLMVFEHEKFLAGKRNNTPFDVLYTNSHKRYPGEKNTFSFLNNSYDFEDVMEVEYGLCSGMSITLRRFNILAYFDQKNVRGEKIPPEQSEAWIEFYRKKIDQVLAHKEPVIFPGFAGLKSLSSVPALKEHLQQHVIREWVDSSVALWRGVIQQLYSVTGTFTLREANQLYKELFYKVKKLGYSPIIWLAKPNSNPFSSKQWIHVVQVLDVSPRSPQGDYTIDVWDVNRPTESAIQKVYIDSQGEATFNGSKLAEVEVLHFDDFEMAEMIKNKLDFCAKNKGLCTKK